VPARPGLLPPRNEKKHQPVHREKTVHSTQFEVFKEFGAFCEDRAAVVDGNPVSSPEEARAPLHSDVCVSLRTNEKSREPAMKEQMKELQKLRGIGEVLSRRLVESSYDTIAKVAAAEKKGLERIAGMNPQKVRSVVTQAREMTGEAEKSRHTWLR